MTDDTKQDGASEGQSAFKGTLGWNRCDVCGKYIAMADFYSGVAKRELVTPDSEYTTEDYETLCKTHIKA